MNERLRNVMVARYQAIIEDCKYKIRCYSDQEMVIPEHPDITLEIYKLLTCLLYTSPSPRDGLLSRMPSSA